MGILLTALGVGIISYIAFVVLFPKAVPADTGDQVSQALDRLYEENRAADEQSTVLREQLNEESALIRTIFNTALMRPLYEAGLQAGYKHNLQQLLMIVIGVFIGVVAVSQMLGMGLIGFLAAVVLAYFVPYKMCRRKIEKRNIKFLDQFPDALDMIVRSVKSGFPLSVALQMLAENTENPVREEFKIVVEDIALGRSLQQALQRLALRINQSDIRFFVVVLSVQQETGGNLAEIIGNLSSIIRKRKQLRHKIHAMTSEGRATAWVLGMLPVFVFGAVYLTTPEYLEPFWTDTLGMMLFATAVGLIVVCAIVVKQMIKVDI